MRPDDEKHESMCSASFDRSISTGDRSVGIGKNRFYSAPELRSNSAAAQAEKLTGAFCIRAESFGQFALSLRQQILGRMGPLANGG